MTLFSEVWSYLRRFSRNQQLFTLTVPATIKKFGSTVSSLFTALGRA